ncbi:MAG: polyprenol monophosphomannose synthase [Rubripirellula sp.]
MSTSSDTADPTAARAIVAVCTLNEAANIVALVQGLRHSMPAVDVLVVDDDSPDGTAKLVEGMAVDDPRIKAEVRTTERGLGSAIRFAMAHAIEGEYDFFLNLDGDFSHDPAQMPVLLNRAQQETAVDVVIGSRYTAGGQIVGWPIHRKIMSRLVNGFATMCLRLPVKDCSGSMRCYRVSALREMGMNNVRVQGYAVLEEVLVQLHRRGSAMAEVPITFTERQQGQSKLTFREAIRSMLQIVSLAFK